MTKSGPGSASREQWGEELAVLAAFLVSSGRGLLREPPHYGPARCLDAARRVLELGERHGVLGGPLVSLGKHLEEVMCGPMDGVDLEAELDAAVGTLAGHLCRDGGPGPAADGAATPPARDTFTT